MCQVKLSICVHCAKVFGAKMKYCDTVQAAISVTDSSPFEITSSFNWSPMEGCTGLKIHHTANLDACKDDVSRSEAPFERPAATRPSARSPYPMPTMIQRTEIREQLPAPPGMEEHRAVASVPLGSDMQPQMQLQIQQMQAGPSTRETLTASSPNSSWSGSTVSYY
ncbi:uncharacterized protein TrAFT101_005931 [Trichoderma asperellum]|uniref:Uncharacterized protein n=1 Tax=Trichoderma asperellum (strain ATCC 204424 / CBS 433.97 / NBRC 101777) TaxID=1042311 RepID=A0A2T3Z7G7_TRIA4|nr:hypothetical protein M441DRAFT_411849 [Trichoderma asperellum CBS 433.97]PTB40771.1 hypothetical protein M441DRAFT_411849 [Trichoderma asperellum CBS 433.97]UKZ90930.1 hypothetical protein TrAFT101_005931 [Trichoderma asperellum]